MAVAHRESHSELLPPFRSGAPRALDAIVVPAGRATRHLAAAAGLASELSCLLVVVCSSGGARPSEFEALAGNWPALLWRCLDVSDGYQHPLLRFPATGAHGIDDAGRASVSTKRNLGLLLAGLLRWRTVLFLDDDIDVPQPQQVADAASGLDTFAAVGLEVADYPDNSVVCHANRNTGGEQGVFVSGSALLVDCTRRPAYFPTVYNEDWFFLHDWLCEHQVGRTGSVRQRPYEPFADPKRAAAEEFGDVLAEGLLDAAHDGIPVESLVSPEYWAAFLERRRAFVDRTRQQALQRPALDQRSEILAALSAADGARAGIDADRCAGFVQSWRADLHTWHVRLDNLPACRSFTAAAAHLGFGEDPTTSHTWSVFAPRPRGSAAVPPITLTPARADTGRQDIAVLLPGFLDSKDYVSYVELAAALPSIGISALRFDLLGSWSNPGTPDEYSVSYHLAEISSLLDRYLPADVGRCVLIGYCYGAHLAALQAATDRRITDVVALMPTRSFIWAEEYDEHRDSWRAAGERSFVRPTPYSPVQREFLVPYPVVADARDYDVTAALRDIRQRILFLAGGDDGVVPSATVRQLHDLCGSPHRGMQVLAGVGHDYRDHPEQIDQVNDTILRWLEPPLSNRRTSVSRARAR